MKKAHKNKYHEFYFDSVTVVDEHNLTAEPIEVHVVLCSGCTNQGTCDYNTIRNQTYEYFKIAACNCNIGFTGMLTSNMDF